MKKIITLALSFIAYFSFGQVTSYTVYTDSTYGCSSFVYVSIVPVRMQITEHLLSIGEMVRSILKTLQPLQTQTFH